jgi:non-heme chloroperoxidase
MPIIQHPTLGDLSYRTSGEGSTALVLLHGWAGSAAYFDPLVSDLDPDLVYCVGVDLPGHGASGEPPGPYTLDLLADATIAAADAAGADTFVLLGFSMSAKFAQFVAHRHPDRVLGQILVAGTPAGPFELPAELVEDWYSRAGDAERLVDVAVSAMTRPVAADELKAFGEAAARIRIDVLRQSLELCADSDFSHAVKGSPMPTLVVGGKGDWIFSPDALRDTVVAPLGDARLEILDCGHEIPLEATTELAELVSAFLTRLRQN